LVESDGYGWRAAYNSDRTFAVAGRTYTQHDMYSFDTEPIYSLACRALGIQRPGMASHVTSDRCFRHTAM